MSPVEKTIKTKNTLLEIIYNSGFFFYHIFRYLHFNIFFYRFINEIKNEKIDILFSSFLLYWRKYIHKTGEIYEYDLMIGDVIEEAKKSFNIICLDNPSISFSNPFRSLKETKNKFSKSNDWICVEQFLSIYDIFKAYSEYIKYLFHLERNEEIYQLFSFFSKYPRFNSSKFNIYLNLILSEKVISCFKPKILFLSYEYGIFHRQLTYISQKKNIPVIALQHGVIEPMEYIFKIEEKEKIILPDITCVYGIYHYNLLTKNSIYEPEQVVVIGSPRYDVLYYADKIYSKEEFLKRYKIDPEHKIVLWATQCHGLSMDENIKNFQALLGAIQNINGTTLIIKQHPGEGEEYTKMIKKYFAEYKINAILTPKNSDGYEQLSVCDLMITKNSTMAMEAIVLNKPVIVVNLSGEPDIVNYVNEGVAKGVYKNDDLKRTIENLLKNDKELANNRKKYIEKYLYKIDGKSTSRVLKLMEKIVK